MKDSLEYPVILCFVQNSVTLNEYLKPLKSNNFSHVLKVSQKACECEDSLLDCMLAVE